jgi:hypothetical protein
MGIPPTFEELPLQKELADHAMRPSRCKGHEVEPNKTHPGCVSRLAALGLMRFRR